MWDKSSISPILLYSLLFEILSDYHMELDVASMVFCTAILPNPYIIAKWRSFHGFYYQFFWFWVYCGGFIDFFFSLEQFFMFWPWKTLTSLFLISKRLSLFGIRVFFPAYFLSFNSDAIKQGNDLVYYYHFKLLLNFYHCNGFSRIGNDKFFSLFDCGDSKVWKWKIRLNSFNSPHLATLTQFSSLEFNHFVDHHCFKTDVHEENVTTSCKNKMP